MRLEFAQTLSPNSVMDKALNDWLVMINSKLDTLINMMNYQREGFLSLPFTKVNISGGGLSFPMQDSCQPGDILEIKMLLPETPPIPLYLYGEVVSVDQLPEGLNVGVQYTATDQDIQELIARYVFNRQREILRERKSRKE